ncbi:MAG: glycoside hydrolase family 5 protein, partial [Bacteroidales bacterium]|nr:glycoside hydrolase family 5 protein [Bacteroidales bacterium]
MKNQCSKICLLACALALITFTANAQTGMTAQEWVANVKIGWNLGNTLDTHNARFGIMEEDRCNGDPLCFETLWDNPVTTKAMITAIKDAGFNAVRIPVTWYKAIDEDFNISPAWMARVTEVVNYAVENDLYIILNSHHDEHLFKFTGAEWEQSLGAFQKIWEQIADNFKDYNEKLAFEALNEPRTIGSALEWQGGTVEEQRVLNEYHQVFVDVVRASGGNNDKRVLIITPYGAFAGESGMNALELPVDIPPDDKLIVSFHNYAPSPFCFPYPLSTWSRTPQETIDITYPIDNYFAKYVNNGIPVIISEFGA